MKPITSIQFLTSATLFYILAAGFGSFVYAQAPGSNTKSSHSLGLLFGQYQHRKHRAAYFEGKAFVYGIHYDYSLDSQRRFFPKKLRALLIQHEKQTRYISQASSFSRSYTLKTLTIAPYWIFPLWSRRHALSLSPGFGYFQEELTNKAERSHEQVKSSQSGFLATNLLAGYEYKANSQMTLSLSFYDHRIFAKKEVSVKKFNGEAQGGIEGNGFLIGLAWAF